MKRVLIITYYWPPSGGAGVQRWLKFAKYLPASGWEPFILTVDPDYATYPVLDHSLEKQPENVTVFKTRASNPFSSYRKIMNKKDVPYGGFANEGNATFKEKVARFIRGNFILPDPRKGWNKFALKKALELNNEYSFDLVITTGPPHSTHLIGKKLRKQTGLIWVADFRDPWTDIYYYKQFYPTLIPHRINLWMEKQVLTSANRVITVSEGLRDMFLQKANINKEKVKIIPNGFDEADHADTDPRGADHFTITYVGSIAENYPLETFIRSLSFLEEIAAKITLRFVGAISPDYREALEKLPVKNIEFTGYVDHDRAVEFMRNAALLLLLIPDHSTAKGILTGKLFEYLAAKRPVLGIGPADGEASKILEYTGAGKMIESDDDQSASEFIQSIFDDFSSKRSFKPGKNYLKYTRKNLTSELALLLDECDGEVEQGSNN